LGCGIEEGATLYAFLCKGCRGSLRQRGNVDDLRMLASRKDETKTP
jgi:hypothetical protein